MDPKYDYDATLNLVKNSYEQHHQMISHEVFEKTLNLDGPLLDKNKSNAIYNAFYRLASRSQKRLGLVLTDLPEQKCIKITKDTGEISSNSKPEKKDKESEHSKDFSKEFEKFSSSKTEKKAMVPEEKVIMTKKLDALSKNNQKLYSELEDTKAANAALMEKCIKLQEKEERYKQIIKSYSELLSL